MKSKIFPGYATPFCFYAEITVLHKENEPV